MTMQDVQPAISADGLIHPVSTDSIPTGAIVWKPNARLGDRAYNKEGIVIRECGMVGVQWAGSAHVVQYPEESKIFNVLRVPA